MECHEPRRMDEQGCHAHVDDAIQVWSSRIRSLRKVDPEDADLKTMMLMGLKMARREVVAVVDSVLLNWWTIPGVASAKRETSSRAKCL